MNLWTISLHRSREKQHSFYKGRNLLSAAQNISTLTTPYKMKIEVETYIPTDKSNGTKDLVKTINVKVECTLAKKTYSTEMSTVRKIKDSELEKLM